MIDLLVGIAFQVSPAPRAAMEAGLRPLDAQGAGDLSVWRRLFRRPDRVRGQFQRLFDARASRC
jgi:hypothetical protein